MSRFGQLEETFDLPSLEDLTQGEGAEDMEDIKQQAQQLAQSYQQRDHLEMHEQEMDEISQLAIEYGKSLHDFGMSVEVRHAGEIFNAASGMLKLAFDARQAKLDKKLKLMKLEMDRIKLDRSLKTEEEPEEASNVRVLDRNELLEQLKQIRQSDELNR